MMHRTRWLAIVALGLGALLLGSNLTGQAAAGKPGGGPGEALPVPDGWQTLAPGQETWYAFDYAGDKSPVLVRMSTAPAGAPSFSVYAPADIERWFRGGAQVPSGRGSPNASYGGDLIWAGSSGEPGTWYVVVDAPASSQAWFDLQVTGSGVSGHASGAAMPAPTATGPLAAAIAARGLGSPAAAASGPAAPAATPAPGAAGSLTAIATPVPPAVAASAADNDRYGLAYLHPRTPTPTPVAQYPADALPIPSGPQTLDVGQHAWYAFMYEGDRSPILIRLHADPAGSAKFTVWSWDVLQRWWEGYFYTPTGQGAANAEYGGDLIWLGGSIVKGKRYVIVEQTGSSPTTYTLTVSGTGVTETLPPTPTVVPTATSMIPGKF